MIKPKHPSKYLHRRALLAGGAALALSPLLAEPRSAVADEATLFRLGTGSALGTYFPIGTIIGRIISLPPGSRACSDEAACGVPGLITVVDATKGSVENVRRVASRQLDGALSQANIAYWAHNGTELFEGEPLPSLRSLANLFPEAFHLVVSADRGIRYISDLKGKRISLDREGSGTLVMAKRILSAYGLSFDDLQVSHEEAGVAAEMVRSGELDGFFFVAGAPARAIEVLAQQHPVSLVPIDGPEAESLIAESLFLGETEIPAGTYLGVAYTRTIAVGAQLIVSAELPEELVYDISRVLWHPNAREVLDRGHPKGAQIRLGTALSNLSVPLHPGAQRYYREVGLDLTQGP